uniref:Beta-endoglucanase n=1 Tax=Xanthomonas albilineans TaxID=29447 RepID=Q60100_XANAL|nr:beta-endoglucanase [Xanthomonas albilineans]
MMMGTIQRLVRIAALVLAPLMASSALADNAGKIPVAGGTDRRRPAFDKRQLSRQLPLIRVDGNRFVDEQGNVRYFAVSASRTRTNWPKTSISIKNTLTCTAPGEPMWCGFRCIQRLAERGVKGYLELLDQAITWNNELGMYTIIDWHSMGNLKSEMFQNSMYHTSKGETFDFWRRVSERYNGINSVAFYEIFNEPTVFSGRLGIVSWAEWKAINEEAITIIRPTTPTRFHSLPVLTGPTICANERPILSSVTTWPMSAIPIPKKWVHPTRLTGSATLVLWPTSTRCSPPKSATNWRVTKGHISRSSTMAAMARVSPITLPKKVSVGWPGYLMGTGHANDQKHGITSMQGEHFRKVMLKENK